MVRIDAVRKIASIDDNSEMAFDLFLGVPKHRAPQVVLDSGMALDDYIPVEKATLATRYPGVYAIGDCAAVGVPKAGAFAEDAGRAVAARLIAAVTSLLGRCSPGREIRRTPRGPPV